MTWFFAILVVAAIGGVAVVAAGRGGSMAETYDDRPDVRVPAEGPLTSSDLRQVRFGTAFRGYRMSEVDALVERLSAELESRVLHPRRGATSAGSAGSAGSTAIDAPGVEPSGVEAPTVEAPNVEARVVEAGPVGPGTGEPSA